MDISISGLFVIVYKNHLTKKVEAYPRLFDNMKKAKQFAKDNLGEDANVQPVFFNTKS